MRHRLFVVAVAALAWAGCRDSADPGRLDPDVRNVAAVHAEFTFSCVQLSCQFTDQTTTDSGTPPVSNWLWTFGDSATSTDQNPAHAYAGPGTYAVTLRAFRSLGESDSVTHIVTVSNDTTNLPPHAEFTFSCTGLTCQFTDQSTDSTGPIVAWHWSFAALDTSSAQNPVYTFPAPGNYGVTLFVFDAQGANDSAFHLVTVANDTINQPPHAGFFFNCSALTCQFFDTSSDSDGVIVQYGWLFGDGGADTVPNPVHTYAAPGSYSVFHFVVDNDGLLDSLEQVVTVDTGGGGGNIPPVAAFDVNCSQLACQFVDQSADTDGVVAQWQWSFGDGTGDTVPNPTHAYAAAGTYFVSLVVFDNGGATDTASRFVTVTDTTRQLFLQATGFKVNGVQHADLIWTGAVIDSFLVFRDSAQIAFVVGDTTYQDTIGVKGSATYIYLVCEVGGVCSNPVMVRFGGRRR